MNNHFSVTNNEGYTFTFVRDSNCGNILVSNKYGTYLGKAVYVYLNDLKKKELQKIEDAQECDREELITKLMQSRFEEIVASQEKRTFEVQCYDYGGQPMVVFSPYGLAGGGKVGGFLFGLGEVAAGILVAGTAAAASAVALPVLLSGGLLAAGASSIYYSIKTKEEDFNLKDLATQSAIGFASGAAGGGLGAVAATAAAPLGGMASTAISAAVIGAGSNASGTIAEATIKQDLKVLDRLTPQNLAISAATGVLTAGASSLAKDAVNSVGGIAAARFLGNNPLTQIASQTTLGGMAGGASGAAVKMTENAIKYCNYLKVMYEKIPSQMEPGRLYVYLENDIIFFVSVNESGELIQTPIKDEVDFVIGREEETKLDTLKDILRSNGSRQFNAKQTNFILESASLYQHKPLALTSGVSDSVAVGASTGLVTGATQAAMNAWRAPPKIEPSNPVKKPDQDKEANKKRPFDLLNRFKRKVEELSEERRESSSESSKRKQEEPAQQNKCSKAEKSDEVKRPDQGRDSLKRIMDRFQVKRKAEELLTGAKRMRESSSSELPKPKSEDNSQTKFNKTEEKPSCILSKASDEQIASAQAKYTKAQQKYANVAALAGYTDVDLENVATNIWNNASNTGNVDKVKYIENELWERFGIPKGATAHALKKGFEAGHGEKHVPKRLQEVLNQYKTDGSLLGLAKQEVDNSLTTLNNLKEPKCLPVENVISPQVPVITKPAHEMVTDAQNFADSQNLSGNAYVEIRHIATQYAGADRGEKYNFAYTFLYDLHEKWEKIPGSNKPTLYGVLTYGTDLLYNGTSTAPIEMTHQSGLQKVLNAVGPIGVGFQTDGTQFQGGTLNHPNLVTVASTESVKIPNSEKPEAVAAPSIPAPGGNGPSIASSLLSSIIPPQPTVVPLPATLPLSGGTTTQTNLQTSVGTKPAPVPTSSTQPSFASSLLGSIVPPQHLVVPLPASLPLSGGSSVSVNLQNNPTNVPAPSPQSNSVLSTEGYALANSAEQALKNLGPVGHYAGNAIGKVTNTLGVLEGIADPAYQDAPFLQKVGCAVAGQGIENTAIAIGGGLGGAGGFFVGGPPGAVAGGSVGVAGATYVADKLEVGEHAQKTCHDVVNLVKDVIS